MRRSPVVARLVTVALVLQLVLGACPALAQKPDVAETHFKHGVSLYQEADFRGALVEFRRAYELSHNWRVLYNVAQAEYQSRDYAAALATFESYLREGGDKIPRPRRAEVDQELARLRMRVGKLTVRANVEGAIVMLDDENVGTAPVTRNVAVGERRIVVKKDGYVTWSKAVEVASNDDVSVDATLTSTAPSVATTTTTVTPPPPPPPTKHFPWEPWVVTGVLAAGAVTTGILALSASSDLDKAKGNFDVKDGELDSGSSRTKTFAIVTDVLIGATAVSAVVSLYLTLKKPAPETSGKTVTMSPALGGLVVGGRF